MSRLKVFFATNRMPVAATDKTSDIRDFSSELGPVDGTSVRFGSAEVDVTALDDATFVQGSLHVAEERLFGDDRKRGSKEIFDILRREMISNPNPAVVTIHGFSNSFKEAIERAATIKHFYGFPGNVFCFTWPSRASALGSLPVPYADYIHDRKTARASGTAMARTIRLLCDYVDSLGGTPDEERCRQPIHLICHSMGNYALRNGLQALMRLPVADPHDFSAEPDTATRSPVAGFSAMTALPTEAGDENRIRRVFDQIILAAADEDADAFEDAHELKFLPRLARRISIYHTHRDWILSTLSELTKFNGQRLGNDGPDNTAMISDRVSAIDVSETLKNDGDIQNHQYYRRVDKVRDDIISVLSGTNLDRIKGRTKISSQRYVLD